MTQSRDVCGESASVFLNFCATEGDETRQRFCSRSAHVIQRVRARDDTVHNHSLFMDQVIRSCTCFMFNLLVTTCYHTSALLSI